MIPWPAKQSYTPTKSLIANAESALTVLLFSLSTHRVFGNSVGALACTSGYGLNPEAYYILYILKHERGVNY